MRRTPAFFPPQLHWVKKQHFESVFLQKMKEIRSLVRKQINEDVIFAGNVFSVHLQVSLS